METILTRLLRKLHSSRGKIPVPSVSGIAFFLILLFLMGPTVLLIAASFNTSPLIEFPPSGFSFQWFVKALTTEDFITSSLVSLTTASLAALISTSLGILTSIVLVRHKFYGQKILDALFLSPLIIPSIITGMALYHYVVLLRMAGTFYALLIGHIIITIPYSIRTISAILHNLDISLEDAARTLGANEIKTFLKITLPLIKPGIIAGGILSFILSWNDFSISLFLSGSKYVTLPLRIYGYILWEFVDPTITAMSTFLIFISALVIILIDKMLGISVFYAFQ
jgi:putative spermidine/putrescine transport system permease protein